MKIPAVANAMGYLGEGIIAEAMEDKIKRKPIAWRKWVTVAACLAVVLAVIAIGNVITNRNVVHRGKDYAVAYENGEYYLMLPKLSAQQILGAYGSVPAPPDIFFSSAEDMKTFLLKGSLTLEQYLKLIHFEKASNGKVAMLDLNAIWEPKLPEGMHTARVIWRGMSYEYWISNGEIRGELSVLSEKSYNTAKEKCFAEKSNAEVVEQYTADGFEITIRVRAGKIADIFGEGNGIYYHAHLKDFPKIADMEWLKSIGLQLYIETE